MTFNRQDTRLPMMRIHDALLEACKGKSTYKEIAEKCSTTPKTISKWINYGPDLKWYSLLDVCQGLELELSDVLRGTRWEKLL